MSNELQVVDWIVNQIIENTKKNWELRTLLDDKEKEYHQSKLYLEIEKLKSDLLLGETNENSLREQAKQEMLNRNLKVIKLFNGMTVQLNESPWAIKIEDEKNIPEEYWKEKITKSIDKIKLKEDIYDFLSKQWSM